ncbi:MAG: phospho-sugar mutase [Spirochaetes bacterium]|nr:phospho-sugar mutase [Spirochaetota bacterium]
MDHESLETRARDYVARETDARFKGEVELLLGAADWKELEDRFYRDLEFGTAGLRGVIGGGFNRMNSFVVRRATQGLSSYIKKTLTGKSLSACIAYDSRRYSREFAEAAACVFAANGIKAFLFSSLRPTPELSFAIRELKADTGIVVTASHNPAKYNGYKVFWNDGAQIIAPHDSGIIAEVEATRSTSLMPLDEAKAKDLVVLIDRQIDDRYVAMVKSKLFRPDLIRSMGATAKIVYTPLHGTGAMHMERIMRELGLEIVTVPEQREGDGEFPTVAFPNPEEAPALKMAVDLGRQLKADVVMATDPDADRLGIAVPDGKGDFALVSGNQLGALLADYMLLSLKESGRMPAKPATIKSIVTTELQARIAEKYGATCFDCLTGFKWIADLMRRFEVDGKGYNFVYGTEESYGFVVENEVRDKDGISAAAMTAEMTLYWRSKGKSLLERLDNLFLEFGFYQEKGINKYFEGSSGMDIMRGIMAEYRTNQPTAFGGVKVTRIRDVKIREEWSPSSPEIKTRIDLPASDVLQWWLEDGTLVTVRPSGTEPKIKFYILARTDSAKGLAAARTGSEAKLSAIEVDIRKVIG